MATVNESVLIHASAAEVWNYYFDSRGWPAWVDGFQAVESDSGYPEQGGTLVWRSTPAGRGTVTEKVVAHEPRRLHRISFVDPESTGELTTSFAIEGEATRVGLELDYRLAAGGPLSWLTDRLFVRSQVVKSLQRSLARLRLETEELADAARQAPAAPPAAADR